MKHLELRRFQFRSFIAKKTGDLGRWASDPGSAAAHSKRRPEIHHKYQVRKTFDEIYRTRESMFHRNTCIQTRGALEFF